MGSNLRFFLCEKPSQGRDIAAVLGATKRGAGFLQGPGVTVTWAVGHLLETAAPEAYGPQFGRPWNISALPVLPAQWQMTVVKATEDQFAVIAKLLKQVDEVVIATDADREGEVIARELLDFCHWRGPVSRLWLSALDEPSIRAALSAIKPGEETLALYYAGLPPTPPCPLCGGKTRLRRGEKGAFYGCEKYPSCKGVVKAPGQEKKSSIKPRKRKQN